MEWGQRHRKFYKSGHKAALQIQLYQKTNIITVIKPKQVNSQIIKYHLQLN